MLAKTANMFDLYTLHGYKPIIIELSTQFYLIELICIIGKEYLNFDT